MSAVSQWKVEWRRFTAQRPGRRFRDRHDRRRKHRANRPWWSRPLNLIGGVVCLAVGAVLAVAPGPAVVFFFLAGILFANESRTTARVLDWIDVRVAPLVAWVGRKWRRLSPRSRRFAVAGMVGGGILCFVAGLFIMR